MGLKRISNNNNKEIEIWITWQRIQNNCLKESQWDTKEDRQLNKSRKIICEQNERVNRETETRKWITEILKLKNKITELKISLQTWSNREKNWYTQ